MQIAAVDIARCKARNPEQLSGSRPINRYSLP